MRPTVNEQLEGMCRILESAIAPELNNGYTLETLRSLVANVRMLGRAWHQLLPFLHWDNAAMLDLLREARGNVDAARQARIDEALDTPPADAADALSAESRNDALRALLCDCLDGPATLTARIAAHLSERSRRYPLRLTGAVPKHKS
jgi:hypothetical protein